MKRRPDPEEPFDGMVDRDAQEALVEVVARLPGATPSAATRARTLRSIADVTRLGLYTDDVAELLGIAKERADALLRRVDDAGSWERGPVPSIDIQHVPEDAALPGTATGFIRMPAGDAFPEHRHLGEELTYVVQGRLRDSDGRVYGPGELVRYQGGSSHAFVALPGPPLIYLFVLCEGMEIAGRLLRVDDPTL